MSDEQTKAKACYLTDKLKSYICNSDIETMAKKITYSEALVELEEIVAKLQNDEVEIDQLKALVTRSTELLAFCKKTLFETDEEVKKILEEAE